MQRGILVFRRHVGLVGNVQSGQVQEEGVGGAVPHGDARVTGCARYTVRGLFFTRGFATTHVRSV